MRSNIKQSGGRRKSKRRSKKRASKTRYTPNNIFCETPLVPRNNSCVLPSSKEIEKQYRQSVKAVGSLQTNIANLVPPYQTGDLEQYRILEKLLGKKNLRQMENINAMQHTNTINVECPPAGLPFLSETYQNPITGQMGCREKTPMRNQFNVLSKCPQDGEDPLATEKSINYLGVAECRRPVMNGKFFCPSRDQPQLTKHVTLPNGTGICVVDHDTLDSFNVPFHAVFPDDKILKKLGLFNSLFTGLGVHTGTVHLLQSMFTQKYTNAEYQLLRNSLTTMSSHNSFSKFQLFINDPTYNPKLTSLVGIMRELNNNPKVRKSLKKITTWHEAAILSLLLNNIPVIDQLSVLKMAVNNFSTEYLRMRPPFPIKDSDLKFFNLNKKKLKEFKKNNRMILGLI